MKIVKEEIFCPVCDSRSYRVLYEPWIDIQDPRVLYGAATGIRGTQTLVTCNKCKMIYENPRFPEEIILEGYKSSQEEGHDSQYAMRVESFCRVLKGLSSYLPPAGARVLDIGTAGGAFLDAAQKMSYQAEGLEPSAFLVEAGKKRGLKIRQGTIEYNDFPENFYDLVCLWDVLEHVVHPKKDVALIKKLLKPTGILLINYPDIGTPMAQVAGKKFWWILSVHLHHFSKETIRLIGAQTGYDLFLIKPYWQTLQLGYLEDMAIHLKFPMAKLIKSLTPQFLQKIPISYYASQTTALFRLSV